MAVSKRLRYEILRRDNHTCRYCGGAAPDVVLTVDHVTPKALGGSDLPENLVAACKDCNSGKTSVKPGSDLVADVADKAVQWGAAIQRWAKLRLNERYERDCYVDQFKDAWDVWGYGPTDDRKKVPRPGGWEASIWQFYEVGLPVEELEDSIKIALGRDRVQLEEKFRYMCGVAWKQVEKMHIAARDLTEAAEDSESEDDDPYVTGFEEGYELGLEVGKKQGANGWQSWKHLDWPTRQLHGIVDGTLPAALRWQSGKPKSEVA